MAAIEYGVPEVSAKIDWYSRQLSHNTDEREEISPSKVENAVTVQGNSNTVKFCMSYTYMSGINYVS